MKATPPISATIAAVHAKCIERLKRLAPTLQSEGTIDDKMNAYLEAQADVYQIVLDAQPEGMPTDEWLRACGDFVRDVATGEEVDS